MGVSIGKQAEVQPAETNPLFLCQFVIYGCVFVNIFILTDKNTSTFSYVLIKVQPHTDICTPTFLYALTIVHPQFYVHWQIYTLNIFNCIFVCTIYLRDNSYLLRWKREKEREGQTGILHFIYGGHLLYYNCNIFRIISLVLDTETLVLRWYIVIIHSLIFFIIIIIIHFTCFYINN